MCLQHKPILTVWSILTEVPVKLGGTQWNFSGTLNGRRDCVSCDGAVQLFCGLMSAEMSQMPRLHGNYGANPQFWGPRLYVVYLKAYGQVGT